MRAAFTYASIACLTIHGLAVDLQAKELASKNPIVKVWNAAARKYGVCYGPGYHACAKCNGVCKCGGSSAPMMYAPAGHHGMEVQGYGEMMHSPAPYEGSHAPTQEPSLAAPEPVYVSPSEVGIPSEYYEPQAKPERKFTPKATEQRTKPQPESKKRTQVQEPPEIEELPAVDPPQLSAPQRGSEESLPQPKIPSLRRNEPDSPSDITPQDLKGPSTTVPDFQRSPMVVPSVPQKPASEPQSESQRPAAPKPATEARPLPKAPAAKPSPFDVNDEDLLVPPDTHLLDSAQFRREPTGRPAYRSANRPRAVIFEPVR
ncbi:hypothetical protein EC9_23710 [Rosistilla ulvae]|uniref:Uncharacterized protein n=1 Tax=Rosistilla ulvae TaxID=1930277 RepID=A0A517LZY8_9BACT|nr:hypothetical protein [Rosistilla ulvae]QDS88183.1 hypothetical protein EC9_23710 [Rosistilla ulvae]